ncbi:hypothetical protein PVAP13_1KG014700 [Panicum virgatum]|uniref:Secreted protein n=1 Tax=Panicum virgatum TaxID=38727 RepID=A0A8T0XDV8_PANVG|nr:hypothetical protein PVAP13_1KG014700 [Panicum virgatum]
MLSVPTLHLRLVHLAVAALASFLARRDCEAPSPSDDALKPWDPSILHSPLLTQQGKSPSWRIGGHWSRASTPSSGAVRLRTCSHPLQVFEPAISCNRTSVRKLILVLLSKQISLLSRST